MMTIRLDDLVIPDFASTEEAEAWGRQQKPECRHLLRHLYGALTRIALNSTDLQRKLGYALQAQLIREACEAIPAADSSQIFPHDCQDSRPHTEAHGQAQIPMNTPLVRETSPTV